MNDTSAIVPDTKDWTWVLETTCPECGYDAHEVDRAGVGGLIRTNADAWSMVLTSVGVTARPDPGTWSVLEYACHVRDVHLLFLERLSGMLASGEAGHRFENWDQDVSAVEGGYAHQAPGQVARELVEAAATVADRYDAVTGKAWERQGIRSNGDRFTVDSFARYHLHDVLHHLWDVRTALTVAAYHHQAADYRAAAVPVPDEAARAITAFADRLGAGARVLEIGSGSGRDASALESAGLDVRRTDITPGFVDLLRADGVAAEVLDPLTDDLTDPTREAPYDAVWANACLLHVERADLPTILARLAVATRPGGLLRLSLKHGDGDAWSTHGSITTPRRFVYWRETPLRAVLAGAGWRVESLSISDGQRGESWLNVTGSRGEAP